MVILLYFAGLAAFVYLQGQRAGHAFLFGGTALYQCCQGSKREKRERQSDPRFTSS